MPDDPPKPAPAEVEPLAVDGVRTAVAGTALWAVALLVTVVLRDDLRDAGRSWWIATAATGAVLGLVGTAILARRRATYRRASSSTGTSAGTASAPSTGSASAQES